MNGSEKLRRHQKLLKKIAITGPESTGKSSLSQQLADYYKDLWVPEFAREYIDKLGRPYVESDILTIAKKQVGLEAESIKKVKEFLFCDTELIVAKIWSEHKYGRCNTWIIDQIEKSDFHLYLLCDIDLPWEPDPQREHPDLREYFFNKYLEELESHHFNYKIVSGNGKDRLENAIKLINESL